MKKFLLLCLILSVVFSYNATSDEINIEEGIYYLSTLFCPEDKPIRKIGLESDDRCGSVIAFYPVRVRDYYYYGNNGKNESCKITSDQMEWIKKIQAETKDMIFGDQFTIIITMSTIE